MKKWPISIEEYSDESRDESSMAYMKNTDLMTLWPDEINILKPMTKKNWLGKYKWHSDYAMSKAKRSRQYEMLMKKA